MYFSKIIPEGNLFDTVLLDEDKGEIYVHCVDDRIPEYVPEKLLDIERNLIYCLNLSALDFCNMTTWKYPLKYWYEREGLDIVFDECEVMEYSSQTLTDFMCKYMEQENEKNEIFQDMYEVADIFVEFYGHKVHTEQMNKYYVGIDPSVRIYFSKEKTMEEKLQYIRMIDNLLQIFTFNKYISKPLVKFTTRKFREFITLHIYDSEKYYDRESAGLEDRLLNHYELVKAEIPRILKNLWKNPVDTSYFVHPYSSSNLEMQKIFADTYFVFDKLANKAYGKEEINQSFEEFKKTIWRTIEQSTDYEQVKEHIGNLRDKIMSHGRESGHKTKLRKAFTEVRTWIPKRVSFYDITDKSVDDIYKLRTEIVHEGSMIDFKNGKWRYVEILQWITFALQLKQIAIFVEEMEELLNMAFGVG